MPIGTFVEEPDPQPASEPEMGRQAGKQSSSRSERVAYLFHGSRSSNSTYRFQFPDPGTCKVKLAVLKFYKVDSNDKASLGDAKIWWKHCMETVG